MHVNRRVVATGSLWFSSILMMVIAVSLPAQSHLAGWSILAAIGGCVPAGWLVIEHVVEKERRRTQAELHDIVRVVVRDLHSV